MRAAAATLACLVLVTGCQGCQPTYYRADPLTGEPTSPAQSLSFEISDYAMLADLFVHDLREKKAIFEQLHGDPTDSSTPAIALLDFSIDMSDRNTKVEIMESRITSALKDAGIRYVDEQARAALLKAMEKQQSDLNDPETRARLGRLANAKYYLKGKLFDTTNRVSVSKMMREFHLFVDLLDVETGVSVFSDDFAIVKVMEK